jgi:hypothetical protein
MKINHVMVIPSDNQKFTSSEFEDAFYDSMLKYSLRHLPVSRSISHELIYQALQNSLEVCYLAGINSKHHFKQIFISDTNIGTLYIDWLMSKKGINLMAMHIPLRNEKMAKWIWELANS